jgi:hypothetical protein
MTTIRELIDGLTEIAEMMPDRLDTELEIGVCNGEDLQIIEKVDVDHYAEMSADAPAVDRRFVMLRGHLHPGEKSGMLLRGVASDVDQEFRGLTDDS